MSGRCRRRAVSRTFRGWWTSSRHLIRAPRATPSSAGCSASGLGTVLGWDEGASESTQTLATRIPTELRGTARPPVSATFPFLPLYETPTEWAAELSNRTVHGVVHLGWVAEDDHYRGELSILVKPNGRLGSAYLLAIKPFRYAAVYPAILRELGRRWDAEVVR